VLKYLEKAVHPHWPMTFEAAKRAVGVMVLLLTAVLLLTPVPLSNVAPAMVISLISLAYVEEDGLLPVYDAFGGSLCTSSGHSSSTSSRISSETSEMSSISSRNLCSRSKSSCSMMWSATIRGA